MSSKLDSAERDFLTMIGLRKIDSMKPIERIGFYGEALAVEVNRQDGDQEIFLYLLKQLLKEQESLEDGLARSANNAELKKAIGERHFIDCKETYALEALTFLEDLYLILWKSEDKVLKESYLLAVIEEIGRFWCPQWRDKQSVQRALELLLSIYGYPVWSEEGQKKFGGAKVTSEVRSKVTEAVKKVFRDSAIRADDVSRWVERVSLSPELVKIFVHPLLNEGDTGFSAALVKLLAVLRVFHQGSSHRNCDSIAARRSSMLKVLSEAMVDKAKRSISAQEALEKLTYCPHLCVRRISKEVEWKTLSSIVIQVKAEEEKECDRDEFQKYVDYLRESLNQWRLEYSELEVSLFLNGIKL